MPVAERIAPRLAHRVRAVSRPHTPVPLPAASPSLFAGPCVPTIASGIVGGTLELGIAGVSPLLADAGGAVPGGAGFANGFGSGGLGSGGSGATPGPAPIILPPGTGTAGVPEPGSWTLLIAGFGVVGTAVRWHRRAEA